MTSALTGFTVPQFSEFDPPVAGEGSLDPMGLGAISEKLSDKLVPDFRARMTRFRLMTAMAVGIIVCDDFESTRAADGVTTPQIAFEWIVLEAFARSSKSALRGVPGMQKARAVVGRRDRLSANSYLKGPSVFGFHGVYKPLAKTLDIVTSSLTAGSQQTALVSMWEREANLPGFVDETAGTDGGELRRDLRNALRRSFESSRCDVAPTGRTVGTLAQALDPDGPGAGERSLLRGLSEARHPLRSELARLLEPSLDDETLTESDVISEIVRASSPALRETINAVIAYENFARYLDTCFRTVCHVSYSLGTTPLKADALKHDPTFVRAAGNLPALHKRAFETLSATTGTVEFDARFTGFADEHTPADLAQLVLNHHGAIQASKPPLGKRPWFEPYKNGWLVRPGYEERTRPSLDGPFIHPIRINALRRFLRDTAV